ncbi:MAG TPA: 4'-phosphopantetheinyl transferase superfamily protein, partial [Gemmatimonadaceae bacterium]|nr:4'-phosphopantetheinyl transferase superfamily protein [Gemmatimonadaceae bacterium]
IERTILRRQHPVWRARQWLSESEHEVYSGLRSGLRREAYCFGRVIAKRVILAELGGAGMDRPDPAGIEISSFDGLRFLGRPRIMVNGQIKPWSVSIAHSDRSLFVAFSATEGTTVGVDVVGVQHLNEDFMRTWLTAEERERLDRQKPERRMRSAVTLWAIKEAFYKAANAGEGFAPRSIAVWNENRAPDQYRVRLQSVEASSVRVWQDACEISALVELRSHNERRC